MKKVTFIGEQMNQILRKLFKELNDSPYPPEEYANLIYQFLTNPGEDYQIDFTQISPSLQGDPKFYKDILILSIVSGYYEYTSYRMETFHHDYSDKSIMAFLDSPTVTPVRILSYFCQKTDSALTMIQKYMKYSSLNYISQNHCLQNLKNHHRLKQAIQLNPFLWDRYHSVYDDDFLLESDEITNAILELYEDYLEQQSFHPSDENIYEAIRRLYLNRLRLERCDEQTIQNKIGYILGNVLENIEYNQLRNCLQQDEILLLEIITRTEAIDATKRFLSDPIFASMVLENFILYNQNMDRELSERKRKIVTENGNIEIISRFNKYFYLELRRNSRQKLLK